MKQRGKRIGIVGGGQLGMMLAEAAKPLGISITVLDKKDCPATYAGAKLLEGKITDPHKIRELARATGLLTFEIEHINADVLEALEQEGTTVHPSPKSLIVIKDKLAQKEFLRRHNIPTADFLAIESNDDLSRATAAFGFPFLLKSRHGGYDGRGNAVVMREGDIEEAKQKLGNARLYAERFVPFARELAVMAARDRYGTLALYPVVETIHEESILRFTLAPAPVDRDVYRSAEALATSVMEHLNGAGVFGIEMFQTQNGEVLVNEIAPRVHNSGHYTIEACKTSQFTQHLLAVSGAQLGDTRMTSKAAAMVNILGGRKGSAAPSGTENAEALGKTTVHWYHKHDVSLLRKMGHITVIGDTVGECLTKAKKARELIGV